MALACDICYEFYTEVLPSRIPRLLPRCGHDFCSQCIATLCSAEDSPACPKCRASVFPSAEVFTDSSLSSSVIVHQLCALVNSSSTVCDDDSYGTGGVGKGARHSSYFGANSSSVGVSCSSTRKLTYDSFYFPVVHGFLQLPQRLDFNSPVATEVLRHLFESYPLPSGDADAVSKAQETFSNGSAALSSTGAPDSYSLFTLQTGCQSASEGSLSTSLPFSSKRWVSTIGKQDGFFRGANRYRGLRVCYSSQGRLKNSIQPFWTLLVALGHEKNTPKYPYHLIRMYKDLLSKRCSSSRSVKLETKHPFLGKSQEVPRNVGLASDVQYARNAKRCALMSQKQHLLPSSPFYRACCPAHHHCPHKHSFLRDDQEMCRFKGTKASHYTSSYYCCSSVSRERHNSRFVSKSSPPNLFAQTDQQQPYSLPCPHDALMTDPSPLASHKRARRFHRFHFKQHFRCCSKRDVCSTFCYPSAHSSSHQCCPSGGPLSASSCSRCKCSCVLCSPASHSNEFLPYAAPVLTSSLAPHRTPSVGSMLVTCGAQLWTLSWLIICICLRVLRGSYFYTVEFCRQLYGMKKEQRLQLIMICNAIPLFVASLYVYRNPTLFARFFWQPFV